MDISLTDNQKDLLKVGLLMVVTLVLFIVVLSLMVWIVKPLVLQSGLVVVMLGGVCRDNLKG